MEPEYEKNFQHQIDQVVQRPTSTTQHWLQQLSTTATTTTVTTTLSTRLATSTTTSATKIAAKMLFLSKFYSNMGQLMNLPQIIAGYRDSANLLKKSADDLEVFLQQTV